MSIGNCGGRGSSQGETELIFHAVMAESSEPLATRPEITGQTSWLNVPKNTHTHTHHMHHVVTCRSEEPRDSPQETDYLRERGRIVAL